MKNEIDYLYAYTVRSTFDKTKRAIITLHLSAHDNVVEHFWTSFIAALDSWSKKFGLRMENNSIVNLYVDSSSFFKEFEKQIALQPLTLLVTNAQYIQNPSILAFLDQLLCLKLPGFEYITICKSPLLASKELTPEKTPYLEFDEERDYYMENHLLLTDNELKQLHKLTNGWLSTIRLVPKMIHNHGTIVFNNLNYHVSQWVERVYFKTYTQMEIEKLTYLSLLESFSLELVRYIYDWHGEDVHSFMAASPIIRYHHETKSYSFAEFILPLLKEKQVLLTNKQKQAFYLRAADWYRDHDKILDALVLYRRMGANAEILVLLKKMIFPFSREEANLVINTIADMPALFIENNPVLHILNAHMLTTLYRYQDTKTLMTLFCNEYDRPEKRTDSNRPLLGEAYILLANASFFTNQSPMIISKLLARAHQLLPEGSSMLPHHLCLFADTPALKLMHPQKHALEKSVHCLFQLEPHIVKITGGNWCGCAYLAQAEMNYYKRNFKEVENNASQAIIAALKHEQSDIACSAVFLLMRYNAAKGNYKKMMESLALLKRYVAEADYNHFFSMPDMADTWLNLFLGKKHDIAYWIQDTSINLKVRMPWNFGRDQLLHAGYLLVNEQFEQLIPYADTTIHLFEMRNYHLLNIYLYMMQACAYYELKKEHEWLNSFEMVYSWCAENEIVMPIIEFGNSAKLLAEKYSQSSRTLIPEAWLQGISLKAHTYATYRSNITRQFYRKEQTTHSLLEQLTAKELKLLLLVYQGTSMKEIASLQKKSYETIRGALRRIYTKLHASSRVDAIRIAAEHHIETYIP